MVGECVEGTLVPRALALDTVTNSITRLIGPMTAGAAYQTMGLAGAYTVSACVYLVAVFLVTGSRTSRRAAGSCSPMCRTISPKHSHSRAAI